jgi:hypothetical protein
MRTYLAVAEAGERVHLVAMRTCGRGALQPQQALEDIHLDHSYHRPAFVAAEFRVAPIDGGDDAAATFDASSLWGTMGIRLVRSALRSRSMLHTYHRLQSAT